MAQKRIKSKIKPIIILIPGNPGIAEYYRTFTERLNEKTSNFYSIHTIDYAGFSLKPSNSFFSIQEELEHSIHEIQQLIQNLNQNNSNPSDKKNKSDFKYKKNIKPKFPIILMGHSIGAWIAREIDKRENLNFSVQQLIYIFPFFHKDPHSKLQKFLELLLNTPFLDRLIYSIYLFLRILPNSLLNKIMSPFLKKMNQNAKNVTWKYFVEHKHILKSVIFLARTEFQTLPYSLFLKDFSMIGNNKFILYNTDDLWAPFWAYECLVQIFPKENIDLYQGSIHDFSTTEEGIEWVSEKISQFLISNK